MADNPTLLLVDDDERFRTRLAKAFTTRGFEVRIAASYEDAIRAASEESPEFAVVDLKMPGRSGLELIKSLKELEPATNIVVLTGYGSIATALDAVQLGATHYLTKPADVDEITAGFSRGKHGSVDVSQEIVVPTLARAEWEHIHRVLLSCNGNISQAAKLLGLHRRSLQRKLTKHPIDL
jgi:two-component system, response regulator RegA